jgi:hypothetical protein
VPLRRSLRQGLAANEREDFINWPFQSECDAFYGNPRGAGDRPSAKWEADNLRVITPPYLMTYDGKPIKGIRVHRKCAASLLRVLQNI